MRRAAAARSACAFALALLAGCATPPSGTPGSPITASTLPTNYSVPKGSPTARLVMRGTVVAPDQFYVYALQDALGCKTPQRVGIGTAQKQPDAANLAAGVLTTLDFVIVKPTRQQCLVRWSFTPVAGRNYAMQGNVSPTGCVALLFDITEPDRVRPAEGAVRRNANGQACLPLDKSPAAPRSMLDGGQSDGEAVLNPAATTTDLQGLMPR